MARLTIGASVAPRSLESIRGIRLSIPHPVLLTHLQFRRFAGCPTCNLHLQSFVRRHDELSSRGIQEVAVFHSTRTAMLRHHAQVSFALIADPAQSLYRQFGATRSILSLLDPRAWPAFMVGLLRHGVELPSRGESLLGLPADFLIDQAGRIVALKYGSHAYDQWEVDDVLALAV